MEVSPHRVILLGLLAIFPVGVYVLDRGDVFAAISLINILIIIGALVHGMRPSTGQHSRTHHGSPNG